MNVDAGGEIIDCRYNKQTANYSHLETVFSFSFFPVLIFFVFVVFSK